MKATTINFKDIKDNNYNLSPKYYMEKKAKEKYAERAIEISNKLNDLAQKTGLKDIEVSRMLMTIRDLVFKQDKLVLTGEDKE